MDKEIQIKETIEVEIKKGCGTPIMLYFKDKSLSYAKIRDIPFDIDFLKELPELIKIALEYIDKKSIEDKETFVVEDEKYFDEMGDSMITPPTPKKRRYSRPSRKEREERYWRIYQEVLKAPATAGQIADLMGFTRSGAKFCLDRMVELNFLKHGYKNMRSGKFKRIYSISGAESSKEYLIKKIKLKV